MTPKSALISIVAGSILAAAPVLSTQSAAGPKHCPPGHEMKGWCSSSNGYYKSPDYRDRDRDRLRRAYEQGYRDGQRNAWAVGEPFPRDRYEYRVLSDYDTYGLRRPPEGYYYAEVDGDILLIQAATSIISALVNSY